MDYLWLGVGLGLVITPLAAMVGSRVDRRIQSILRRLLGDGAASEGPSREFLNTQAKDSPELAKLIQDEPAVPVEDQPPELTPPYVAAIEAADNLKDAQKISRGLIGNPDVADACAFLIWWKTRRHR